MGGVSGARAWAGRFCRFFEAQMNWLHATFPRIYSILERVFSEPQTRGLTELDAFFAALIIAKNVVCFDLLLRYRQSLVAAVGGAIGGGLLFTIAKPLLALQWDLFEIIFFYYLTYVMYGARKIGFGFFCCVSFGVGKSRIGDLFRYLASLLRRRR